MGVQSDSNIKYLVGVREMNVFRDQIDGLPSGFVVKTRFMVLEKAAMLTKGKKTIAVKLFLFNDCIVVSKDRRASDNGFKSKLSMANKRPFKFLFRLPLQRTEMREIVDRGKHCAFPCRFQPGS